MKKRHYDISNHKPEKIDSRINKNYSSSYLNNTKWYKLMEGLTDDLGEVYLNYKLIYDEIIKGFLFDSADFKPFFLEPILYKEVEWIEIPAAYKDYANKDHHKVGFKLYKQDLEKIISVIDQLGKYHYHMDEHAIRIYAYQ